MLLRVLGTVTSPALQGTTASSFMYRSTAANNSGTFIEHLHVLGTLRTQHPFLLGVQLWASYQSLISLSFPTCSMGIVVTDCLPGLLHSFKRDHTCQTLSTAPGTQPAFIECQEISSSIVSRHDFI